MIVFSLKIEREENKKEKKSLHTSQSFYVHHRAPNREETQCCVLLQVTSRFALCSLVLQYQICFSIALCKLSRVRMTYSLLKQSAFYSLVYAM